VFEDAEDMRASFAEEKDRNIAATATTRTLMSLWKKYARWKGQLLVCFAGMAAVYSTMAALLKSGII
jgi:O-succinylhomoserine sulfhydrylase